MTDEIIKKLESINSKLGILIALQMIDKKPETSRDKIKLLGDLGVETAEIASILGTTYGFVSKERSLLKSKQKNQNG